MEVMGATTAELQELAEQLGQPKYRGKQLAEWVYKKGAENFDSMSNLPAEFRQKLNESATFSHAKVVKRSVADDGTAKFLLEFSDGRCVETVFLPYSDRITACVSTQAGCPAGCTFCASTTGGFARSLTPGEIVDQVLTIQKETVTRVTNVVFMGMGEPLLNYDNVLKSIEILNKEVGIGMRKITVSTVGIIPKIRHLLKEKMQFTLAISLHAPNDYLRNKIMPITKKNPLKELIPLCKEYAETTGRRITFEYLMIHNVNDDVKYANQLVFLLKGVMSAVNLIPYNEVPGKGYYRSTPDRIEAFRAVLEKAGVETTQRFEKGSKVDAACGQLRARHKKHA